VSETVTGVLGHEVPDNAPLMASGLDSLNAVELRNALESKLAAPLPPTLLFDYPTIDAVTGFVQEQVRGTHSSIHRHYWQVHSAQEGSFSAVGARTWCVPQQPY